MKVGTHILTAKSLRSLNRASNGIAKALERLSTGRRVNTARDDASSLAIGNGLEAQRRGQGQALRNLSDAKGFLETSEGAIRSQIEIVQRIRELTIQAAQGALSQVQRDQIQVEVDQLTEEFDRIAKTTEFNGVKLMDGSFTSRSIQLGGGGSDVISFSLPRLRARDVFTDLRGTGAFTQVQSFSVGAIGRVLSGDFNGDGLSDLAHLAYGTSRWFRRRHWLGLARRCLYLFRKG